MPIQIRLNNYPETETVVTLKFPNSELEKETRDRIIDELFNERTKFLTVVDLNGLVRIDISKYKFIKVTTVE